MIAVPTRCQTIQIAPNEHVLGPCGRELKNGYCSVHGHHTTAPSRWMISPVLVDEPPEIVVAVSPSMKSKLLTISKIVMVTAVGVGVFWSTAIGLFWLLAGLQFWITIKCWMR